jgi:uncharacterized protein
MEFKFPAVPASFNVMAKPAGPACNLRCTYCYYLEKKGLYGDGSFFRMGDEVLELFIKDYICTQKSNTVSFVWQGGEPALLGVDFFKKVVGLQVKYAGKKKIENSFQTNGILLTDEFCQFFRENNFLIGISIDGPRDLHDFYRKDKNGRPSWERVMEGIRMLQKHKVEFNTLSVVNDITAKHPLRVYRFLKEIGSRYIQFLPVLERTSRNKPEKGLTLVHQDFKGDADLTEWSVSAQEYGHFLTAIFNEWVRNDVGNFFIQMFEVTLANWVGAPPGLCVFAENCGTAIVMEHNGDVYSCDHFVYEDHFIGNIRKNGLAEMLTLTKHSLFGQDKKSGLSTDCKSCKFLFTCHGDCPKHRFDIASDGKVGLSFLCKSYKQFFSQAEQYMDFMAKEIQSKRPASNVMQWIRSKEGGRLPERTTIGRNEPCPCKSGKKFKLCHGRTRQ